MLLETKEMTTEVGHSNDGVEVEQQMFAVIPQIYFGDAPGLVEPKTATTLTTNTERATSTTEDTTITLIIQVATAIIVLVIVLWLLITLMRSTLPEKKLGKKQ
tara:strand:- start:906 stop:1214 length:309 start_codon:yes stop_codon:yes gene_type:complete